MSFVKIISRIFQPQLDNSEAENTQKKEVTGNLQCSKQIQQMEKKENKIKITETKQTVFLMNSGREPKA